MKPHEVIVYRSPLEKQFYDFWLSQTGLEIIFWGVVGVVVVFVGMYLYSRYKGY